MNPKIRQKIEAYLHAKIRVYPSQRTIRGDAIYAEGYYHPDDGSDPGRRLGYVGQADDILKQINASGQ